MVIWLGDCGGAGAREADAQEANGQTAVGAEGGGVEGLAPERPRVRGAWPHGKLRADSSSNHHDPAHRLPHASQAPTGEGEIGQGPLGRIPPPPTFARVGRRSGEPGLPLSGGSEVSRESRESHPRDRPAQPYSLERQRPSGRLRRRRLLPLRCLGSTREFQGASGSLANARRSLVEPILPQDHVSPEGNRPAAPRILWHR